MPKRVLLQCATAVNRDAVRREVQDGVEYIVVSSFTLPPNVVMNGVLYPASEVDAGYPSLERTLAPVEHPTDAAGNFISANDPIALHNFHVGAFNCNVSRADDGRLHVEKWIDVQQAGKSDKGKRLLDRVAELETSEKPRPVHTSVGVWLEPEAVEPTDQYEGLAVNAQYSAIARGLVFDHDAILLDSVGAAQPGQGVGMAVNSAGDECEVHRVGFEVAAEHASTDELSHGEIRAALYKTLENAPYAGGWIRDVWSDRFIFEVDGDMFAATYTITDGVAALTSAPVAVVEDTNYTIVANTGDKVMRELIVAALKAANIDVDGKTDDELLEAYGQLQANAESDTPAADDIASAVLAGLEPLTARLDALEQRVNSEANAARLAMNKRIADSKAYPNLSDDDIAALPLNVAESMAARLGAASVGLHAVPVTNSADESSNSAAGMQQPE